jgi:hypothetical protein
MFTYSYPIAILALSKAFPEVNQQQAHQCIISLPLPEGLFFFSISTMPFIRGQP